MPSKTLIILPTYNEAPNIKRLILDLLSCCPDSDILVIDDNSPDETAGQVRSIKNISGRVKLVQRPGKMGLGTAYVAGFKYALENNYEIACQMDSDFSHDPSDLAKLICLCQSCDLAIGSRYVKGGKIINWPSSRRFLSLFANLYSRAITGLPVRDTTGGFKCFTRKALLALNLAGIKSNGYSFQIETNYLVWKNGLKIKELPITFKDRAAGISKMSKKEIFEAIVIPWKLKFKNKI